jgi:hypothetical protein
VHKCTTVVNHVLEKPTHAFGEVISKTRKIYNLFLWYLNNTYFSVLESS